MNTVDEVVTMDAALENVKQFPYRRRRGMCACGEKSRKGQRTCKGCHAATMREHRKTHRLTGEARMKMNCRSYLKTYIKRGLISKGPCEWCGATENIEAHWTDYRKPLEFHSLCRDHRVMVTQGFLDLKDIIRQAA